MSGTIRRSSPARGRAHLGVCDLSTRHDPQLPERTRCRLRTTKHTAGPAFAAALRSALVLLRVVAGPLGIPSELTKVCCPFRQFIDDGTPGEHCYGSPVEVRLLEFLRSKL